MVFTEKVGASDHADVSLTSICRAFFETAKGDTTVAYRCQLKAGHPGPHSHTAPGGGVLTWGPGA